MGPEVEPVGYVNARDVAQAVRRALEADVTGSHVAIVAAADTCMRRDSADLLAEVFPGVPLQRPVVGRETLLAIDRARSLLGYAPEHSWLDERAPPGWPAAGGPARGGAARQPGRGASASTWGR
ncbi:MAG TPA: hypothetical protein VF971_08315 [Candidatus Limnocylindrales bacterium]|jgi:nucleoside-diphosphate-sugar epimerase